jgi:spore germination protein KC
MHRKQRIIAIIILIFNTAFFTGCWNYREVNTLAVVMAATVDRDEVSNEYILTVEVVSVTGGENSTKLGKKIYESRGQTVFESGRNLVIEIGRRAYWSHSKAIIINSSIAEEDISDVLDWFYRDQELRRDVNVFIYKGDRAADVLKSDTGLDDTLGYNLHQTVRNRKSVNKYPDTDLGEVVGNLSEPGKGIIMPLVLLRFEQEKVRSHVEGSAILKGTKVIGYLGAEDTRITLAILGELKKGVIPIKDLMNTGENATMELYGAKNKVEIDYEEERLTIKFNAKLELGIAEITGDVDFRDEEIRGKMTSDIGRVTSEKVKQTISKVQSEYRCDIFKFGTKMQIQYPKEWKKIKKDWNEKFSSASIESNIDVHIRGSATASKPIKGGE